MSRSYLVTDPTQSLALLSNPDCLTISEEPGKSFISVEQIRNLKEWISLKPFSSLQKIVFIPNANKMTVEAQNSLLKMLEEPPLRSFIVLSCKNKRQLLPTVISRCLPLFALNRLLEVPELSRSFTTVGHSDKSKAKEKENNYFENLTLIEGFELAEKLAKLERSQILKIIDCWIDHARQNIRQKRSPRLLNTSVSEYQALLNTSANENQALLKLLKELYLLRQRIGKNVGIRLAVENFFLQTKV